MLEITRYIRPLGLAAIAISIGTWCLEWAHLVEVCPYCQTQRTMIGLLGILMILPDYRYVTILLAMILGLFGINVSSAQIFKHVLVYEFMNSFLILAACALCIMSAQMLILFARARHNSTHTS